MMRTLLFILSSLSVSCWAFTVVVQPNGHSYRRFTTTHLHAGVGVFFGTSTGNTQSAAELIAAEFGAPEPIDIDSVQGSLATEFAKYDALIVGTPTWNTGADTERSGTAWDEVYYGEMQDLNLQGKNVAVFGMGDSVSYAENYADGSGELHDVFVALGCHMMGYTSQEGYEHEDSKAIRGDKFCGLLLDNVNFEELTEGRIQNWVAQLKEEGILSGAASSTGSTTATAEPPSEVPAVTATTTVDFDPSTIIAQLEQENAALRLKLEEFSTMLDNNMMEEGDGANGFKPHYNAVTGRTMWTSADGRTCYYTEASTKFSP